MPTIFCYVRPWNADQFTYLASKVGVGAKVVRCSEHRKVDESFISAQYAINLKKKSTDRDLASLGLLEADVKDIISRCRLMRMLPPAEARRHVAAMADSIDQALARFAPIMILSITIDSFVMDLLRQLAIVRGIRFIGVIGTFVNGYFRLSSRGEVNINHAADISIVPDLKRRLLKADYAPAFNKRSLVSPRRSVWRRWAANVARVPYFFVRRCLSGEFYNYHYWVSQRISASQFHWLPPSDPGADDWRERIESSARTKLFLPLQMFPECTVDYWCQDVEVIDYYNAFESLISVLSTRFQVVVKEHPSVMASRPYGFYSKLSRDSRLIVVPTYTPSNDVLPLIDGVVVWTGSVGFESILRGTPVFGLAKPFYASGKRFCHIELQPDLDLMEAHIAMCKHSPVSDEEQDGLLAHLASQLFKGDFINDGTWDKKNPKHLEKMDVVAQSLLNAESEVRA